MKFTKEIFIITFFSVLFGLHSISLAKIDLVKEGKSSYSIVISGNASDVEKFAASEFQNYIEKISGVKLPVKHSAVGNSIFIGEALAVDNNISLNKDELGFDGFIIKSSGKNLFLAGRNQRGTLYAVYTLLEKIGCKWYAPNFDFYGKWGGEFIPSEKTITIPDLDIREKPDFKYRKKYVEEGYTHTVENMIQLIDWMAKVRMNVFVHPVNYQNKNKTVWDNVREALIPELKKRGMIIEVGGHGYQTYLSPSKYFKEHPDWFGLKDGQRSSDERVVFNTTNVEALDQLSVNIIAYLKLHPEVGIFDLWPPDEAIWPDDSASLAQGTVSDRQAIVLNYVFEKITKEFPNLKLEFIAYSKCISPPSRIKIENPNVIMDFCPYSRSFAIPFWDHSFDQNALYDNILKEWLKQKIFLGDISYFSYWRKYIWRSLPVVIPNQIQKESQYFKKLGLAGIGSYSEPGDWFTYEIDHYIISKTSWNSNLSLDSLLSDYYKHRFDKSNELLRRYFELIENTVPKASRILGTSLNDLDEVNKYLSNLDTCSVILDKAAKIEKGNQFALFLLNKLKLSLQYTILDLKIRKTSLILSNKEYNHPAVRINELTKLYSMMKKLFNNNLNEGIFISRGMYYQDTLKCR